jgi:mannose-6-phosphate isomerase-like protein (cupin superfamily)
MQAFEFAQLEQERAQSNKLYLEFLRVPALSAGVYTLKAGQRDPQSPHHEDEVYYIVEGEGMIRVAEADRSVKSGSIVYVAAHVPHHFHSITADLKILVFFAPAESDS